MAHHSDPYREQREGAPWAIVVLLVIACLLVGYAFASDGSGTVSAPVQMAGNDPTLVSLQKTAFAPTVTKTATVPQSTATLWIMVVTPTRTATASIDYCSVAGLHTPCALPPGPEWTPTPMLVCDQVTPNPGFETMCQKRDTQGVSAESETR